MHLYRISGSVSDSRPAWEGTLNEAHAVLKLLPGADARIELMDIDTSKDGVLRLARGTATGEVLRTWALTPRRGLKEVPNGE